jgi:DNA polymerase-3 subunit gamma/tau
VFENIIEQGAALQLRDDILSDRLAPSMLFFGPPETGKGSVALELARVLSCRTDASWKCSCPACARHRYLQHTDLLIMGFRPFQAEIAAARSSFLRDPSPSAKTLFIRSMRKLLVRFSPVLMEDDPKLGKISSVLRSIEEEMNEFEVADAAPEKLSGSLVEAAGKLIKEGMGENIPVGHVRRAAYWCRLAPNGKRKMLLIESAERMKDEARNSLLKLLEEPPQTVNIVLTTPRREAIMPTILSRLRPYRFLKRSAESEKDVIRRVFRGTVDGIEASAKSGSLISAYLDSFLSGGEEKLYPVAVYFIASLAQAAVHSLKKNGAGIPGIVNALTERYAPIAAASGYKQSMRTAEIIKTVIAKSGSFEDDSFSRFLTVVLDLVSVLMKEDNNPQYIAYNVKIKKYIGEAETATSVLNQNVTLALEALFHKLKKLLTGDING